MHAVACTAPYSYNSACKVLDEDSGRDPAAIRRAPKGQKLSGKRTGIGQTSGKPIERRRRSEACRAGESFRQTDRGSLASARPFSYPRAESVRRIVNMLCEGRSALLYPGCPCSEITNVHRAQARTRPSAALACALCPARLPARGAFLCNQNQYGSSSGA